MNEPPRPPPPEPPADSAVLLQQAKSGNQRALQQLLVMHMEPLRAFARLQADPLLRARESESDVVQQVCVEVLQRAEQFRFQGESKFRCWLYGAGKPAKSPHRTGIQRHIGAGQSIAPRCCEQPVNRRTDASRHALGTESRQPTASPPRSGGELGVTGS